MVDPEGRPVELRGVNLGNWLMLEMWMLAQPGQEGAPGDQYRLEEMLSSRFGEARKDALMELYRSNFMLDRDFSIIRSFRFNLIRLPLNYRMFEDDRRPKQLRPNAFKWVDRALQKAERYGMYVILDLHGAQGGQSVYDHTGRSGQNKLWESEENQQRMAWLWEQLAKRYRGRSTVLAYDVFNEPYGGTHAQQKSVFSRCYAAIRKHDPDTLILAHGHWDGFEHYGTPTENGWHNVGYQMHYYPGLFGFGTPNLRTHVLHLENLGRVAAAVNRFNAPFLIGEMNVVFNRAGGAEMMRRYYDLHAKNGWMTTMWSYKVFGREGGFGSGDHWGMVTNADPLPPVRFDSDSYDQIAAWMRGLGTMRLAVNEPLRRMLAPEKVSIPALPELPASRTTAPEDAWPGWESADLGGALKGGLKDEGGGKFKLYGAGEDIWARRDEGRFLHQRVDGDFRVTVKIDRMEELEQYSKSGLMIRSSLDFDAPAAILTSFTSGEMQFGVRPEKGGEISAQPSVDQDLPLWIRLERRGSKVSGFWSKDGSAWSRIGEEAAFVGGPVLAGVVALSHDPKALIEIGYSGLLLERL